VIPFLAIGDGRVKPAANIDVEAGRRPADPSAPNVYDEYRKAR